MSLLLEIAGLSEADIMPQVPMFHRLSFPRRNSRSVAKFEQQGRADGHSVASADDYSVDEDGCVWRVVQKYCTDYRAAMDMQNIVDDIYLRATEFVHQTP